MYCTHPRFFPSEIVDLSFYRSEAYQAFFDSLDRAGGKLPTFDKVYAVAAHALPFFRLLLRAVSFVCDDLPGGLTEMLPLCCLACTTGGEMRQSIRSLQRCCYRNIKYTSFQTSGTAMIQLNIARRASRDDAHAIRKWTRASLHLA